MKDGRGAMSGQRVRIGVEGGGIEMSELAPHTLGTEKRPLFFGNWKSINVGRIENMWSWVQCYFLYV